VLVDHHVARLGVQLQAADHDDRVAAIHELHLAVLEVVPGVGQVTEQLPHAVIPAVDLVEGSLRRGMPLDSGVEELGQRRDVAVIDEAECPLDHVGGVASPRGGFARHRDGA
jgi:hypothetical protein